MRRTAVILASAALLTGCASPEVHSILDRTELSSGWDELVAASDEIVVIEGDGAAPSGEGSDAVTIASAQVVTTLIPDLGTLEPGDTGEIQQPGVDGLVQLTPDIDYLEPGQQYAVFLNRAHLAGDAADDYVVVGITTGIFSADAELAEGDPLAGVTFTHDGPYDGDSLPRSCTIEDLQD